MKHDVRATECPSQNMSNDDIAEMDVDQSDEPSAPPEPCPICLEAMNPFANQCTTTCGHSFHLTCVLRIPNVVSTPCPICRKLLLDPPIEPSSEENVRYARLMEPIMEQVRLRPTDQIDGYNSLNIVRAMPHPLGPSYMNSAEWALSRRGEMALASTRSSFYTRINSYTQMGSSGH